MTESTVSSTPNLSYRRSRQSRQSYPIPRTKSAKPSFVIGGYNGGPIVETILLRKGWLKIYDKNSDDFNLKWTETLHQINFYRIRPSQLVNHIPNCGILTNKLGLLLSLRGYERYCKSLDRATTLTIDDFIPTTFIVDDLNERNEFYKQFKENDIWISKPVSANQGKGISLIRNISKFKSELHDVDRSRSMWSLQTRIVQRYITNPLLIYRKKFDLRSYMLIASTVPYLVLFSPGYVRLSMNIYSNNDENLITHLTNQFIQKKSPKYNQFKEESVMSIEQFNRYFNDNCKDLPNYKPNWVETDMVDRMKAIILHVFKSIKQRLANNTAYFELYGLDFMVDTNLKLWLIEANSNPSMSTQCSVLRHVIPAVVEETLMIALECFDKNTKLNRPLLPLDSIKRFQIIYCENFEIGRSRRFTPKGSKKYSAPGYLISHSNQESKRDSQDDSSLTTMGGSKSASRLSNPVRKPISDHWLYKYQHNKVASLSDRLLEGKRTPLLAHSITTPTPFRHTKAFSSPRVTDSRISGDIRSLSKSIQAHPFFPTTQIMKSQISRPLSYTNKNSVSYSNDTISTAVTQTKLKEVLRKSQIS